MLVPADYFANGLDKLSLDQCCHSDLAYYRGWSDRLLAVPSITAPLSRLQKAMSSLSSGQLTCEIADQTRKDEIGEMARSLEVFREKAKLADDLAHQQQASRDQEDKRHQKVHELVVGFDAPFNRHLSKSAKMLNA